MACGSARGLVPASIVALVGATVVAQTLPPGYVDPEPVLAAAAKAIGSDRLKCVTISGTAYGGAVGQQRESARNVSELHRSCGICSAGCGFATRWLTASVTRGATK